MAKFSLSSSKTVTTLTIRFCQFVFTILCLGLAAGVISDLDGSFSDINFIIAASVLTFIYLVMVFVVPLVTKVPLLFFLVWESIMVIFWLTVFAIAAHDFGSCVTSISGFRTTVTFNFCKIGKAIIPFALFNWFLFIASLVLYIMFVVIPHSRSTSFSDFARTVKNDLAIGAIFSNRIPQPSSTGGVVDPEANVVSTDEEPKGPEVPTAEVPSAGVASAEVPSAEGHYTEVPVTTVDETTQVEPRL